MNHAKKWGSVPNPAADYNGLAEGCEWRRLPLIRYNPLPGYQPFRLTRKMTIFVG